MFGMDGVGASGRLPGGGSALANVGLDPTTKTITADLPRDLSKPAYLTIQPAVDITRTRIQGSKLVITYR